MSDDGETGRRNALNGAPRGTIPRAERERLARESAALEERIAARKQAANPAPVGPSPGKAYGYVARLAIDIVAGPFVGGAIGWWLDTQLGTAPWLLILFVIFGIGASVRSATATYRQLNAEMSAASDAEDR